VTSDWEKSFYFLIWLATKMNTGFQDSLASTGLNNVRQRESRVADARLQEVVERALLAVHARLAVGNDLAGAAL
jgi:hypothetical protein